MILWSIKKCCINNAMGGTDDGAIFGEYGSDAKLDTDNIHP